MKIQRLLSSTWFRLILYLILVFLIYFSILISEIIILDSITSVFSFLLPAVLIESLRKESKWFAFGIRIDKYLLYYFLIGFVFALVPILLFIPIKLFLGYEFSGFTDISANQLFNTILFTFITSFVLVR